LNPNRGEQKRKRKRRKKKIRRTFNVYSSASNSF
jgi:hypothetical protein